MVRTEHLLEQSEKDVEFYRDVALKHLDKIRHDIEILIDYIERRDDGEERP